MTCMGWMAEIGYKEHTGKVNKFGIVKAAIFGYNKSADKILIK